MAINFLTGLSVRGNIDLNGNELQNVVIHPLGTAPSAPTVGQIYYDSTGGDLHPYFFNGNTWDKVAFTSDVPTVNNSQITITAGTGLSTGGNFTVNQGSPSEITIDHDTFTTSDTTPSGSTSYSGTFNAVTDLTIDNGHVTSVETTAYTMPAAFSWSITDQTDTGTFSGSNTTLTIQSGGSVSVELLGNDNRVFNVSHDQISGGVGSSSSSATPGYGQTFTAIGGITVNNEGHVSSIDTKTITIPASDNTDTDTKQSIAADTTDADRYLTSVASATGAQTGFSHANLTYNASTETLKVKNLEVSGTTTSIQTETITLDDNIILLNSNKTGAADTNAEDAGIEVERGDDANVRLFWDESEDAWTVTNTSGTHQLLQAAGGTAGKLKVDLEVDPSSTEPNVTSISKTGNTYTVTHGLNTTDLMIQLIDVSSGSNKGTVFADIERPSASTITVAFGISVTDGDYRLLVTQI